MEEQQCHLEQGQLCEIENGNGMKILTEFSDAIKRRHPDITTRPISSHAVLVDDQAGNAGKTSFQRPASSPVAAQDVQTASSSIGEIEMAITTAAIQASTDLGFEGTAR